MRRSVGERLRVGPYPPFRRCGAPAQGWGTKSDPHDGPSCCRGQGGASVDRPHRGQFCHNSKKKMKIVVKIDTKCV
jgi:hypothetical protein